MNFSKPKIFMQRFDSFYSQVQIFQNFSLKFLYLSISASMYSSLQNTVSQQSLTREKWLETKRLPDWTDFTDAAALRDDRQR